MIDFKDFEELTVSDTDDVNHYIEQLNEFTPLIDEVDYLAIKKYIRKILEIIEKDEVDDKGRD